MTYAYDDYIQMPTKDLYDTAVMKMAIDAAKDMYDKGLTLMENFYKTYGDFMSPFAKDMQKYGEAMNYVRETVNDAYARGIDLARSPEGRALIQQLTHSVDPLWYNTARANAKVGYTYLDSLRDAMRNGTYDKAYEDWLLNESGLGSFNEFSSDKGMWNRSGVSKFLDINLWTHHLFDNMQLTYDPELSKQYPGYIAYSKNKDVMNQIAANNMASLASSDMGRFLINKFEQQGLTTEQAVQALQKLIVNSNWEQGLVKLEQDPYEYARYTKDLQIQADAAKSRNQVDEYRQKKLIDRDFAMDINGDGRIDNDERNTYTKYMNSQMSTSQNENIPPAGPTDEVIAQQVINEQNRRSEYTEEADKNTATLTKRQNDNYKKLSPSARVVAKQYMMHYDRMSDPNADEVIKGAKQKAENLAKKDPAFEQWMSSYKAQRLSKNAAEQKWNAENTTSGLVGYRTPSSATPSTEKELYDNSEKIYRKNNVVSGLDNNQKAALDSQIGYREGENENEQYAYADDTVEFKPITTASMTGNRMYRHNSVVNKVARAIKGKKYTVNSTNINREYGSGVSNGKRVYIISETVTFSDKETVEALDKIPLEQLLSFGITKNGDGDDASYNIPIMHKFGHGVGSAAVNTQYDKQISGTSEAAKRLSYRQAREISALIK